MRPFKPQNMSNNAAVTADGGEIGRAQALQAQACGVAPVVHMNPVLLKPQSEIGAQVVVQGQVCGRCQARDYRQARSRSCCRACWKASRVCRAEADLVLVEGAGSPAEINLRAGDIANMGFAEAADVPVVLVGDIDRGGVIASLVGTHALLAGSEAARIKALSDQQVPRRCRRCSTRATTIARRTGLECLGVRAVVRARAPACRRRIAGRAADGERRDDQGAIKIVVPRLSRIANFDDLDPLRAEPDVRVRVRRARPAAAGAMPT